MKILLASSVLLFASSAFAAGAPSLTGQWSIHNSIAGNDSDQQCTFLVVDNKISGSCKGNDNNSVQVSGSIDGDKLTWKYEVDYNGTPLTLVYTVTGGDADKITGSVEVQPFNVTGDFSATPSKEGSQPAK
jgi:hypothetical protein